jgi:hypothetical protein
MATFAELAKRDPKQRAMSTVHHLDTVQHNIAHAKTHMDAPSHPEYNLAHAKTHLDAAASHAADLQKAVGRSRRMAPHAQALKNAVDTAKLGLPAVPEMEGQS